MPEEANTDPGLIALLDTPVKLSELVLAGTALCYVSGFAITNLYFGSLGIVSFDMLRARYILTGFLFAVFVGLFAFLVRGLLPILRNHPAEASSVRLFADVIFYSVTRFVLVSVCVVAVVELSGSTGSHPVGIPSVSPPLPWSEWLSSLPALWMSAVRTAGVLVLVWVGLVLVVSGVLLVVNPKKEDGTRPLRKTALRRAASPKSLKDFVLRVIGSFVFYPVLITAVSLLHFLALNEVRVGLFSSGSSGLLLSSHTARFMGAVFGLYGVVAASLVLLRLVGRLGTETGGDPRLPQAVWVFLVAVLIGIVLPVYSLGVFPTLSQQVGGGKMVPVDVLTSSEGVSEWLGATSADVYLIDRASNSSLFLIMDSQGRRMVEVTDSELQAITYKQSWLNSGGRDP